MGSDCAPNLPPFSCSIFANLGDVWHEEMIIKCSFAHSSVLQLQWKGILENAGEGAVNIHSSALSLFPGLPVLGQQLLLSPLEFPDPSAQGDFAPLASPGAHTWARCWEDSRDPGGSLPSQDIPGFWDSSVATGMKGGQEINPPQLQVLPSVGVCDPTKSQNVT